MYNNLILFGIFSYRRQLCLRQVFREGRSVMQLKEFLDQCRSDDLAHALRELGLPVTGNKPDRIGRIVDHHKDGTSTVDILSAFRVDDVRRAAKAVGIEGA